MNTKLKILCFILFVPLLVVSQTVQEFNKKANELYIKNDFDSAIIFAKQATKLAYKQYGGEDTLYAGTLFNLAILYKELKKYSDAEPLYENVLFIIKNRLGNKHPVYATILKAKGDLYSAMNLKSKAETLYIETLALRKETIGILNSDYITSLVDLAYLYASQKRYNESSELYEQQEMIALQLYGPMSLEYSEALNQSSILYRLMEDLTKAEQKVLKSFGIQEKLLGNQHPDYAASLNMLGMIYEEMENYSKADSFYTRALAIRKIVLGTMHPDYAKTLTSQAIMYSKMRMMDKAEENFSEASKIIKTFYGVKSVEYASVLNDFATHYFVTFKYRKADSMYQEALQIRTILLGKHDPAYIETLEDLALTNFHLGFYSKAESLFLDVLFERNKMGTNTPEYARTLNGLAVLYMQIEKHDETEKLLTDALVIVKKLFGENNKSYRAYFQNLATEYIHKGNYDEAEKIYNQLINSFKILPQIDSTEYASLLSNAAVVYSKTGDYVKALNFQLEALKIKANNGGVQSLSYAISLGNLGLLYTQMGNYKQAEPLYFESLHLVKSNIGIISTEYFTALNNLGDFYQKIGNVKKAEANYLDELDIIINLFGSEHPSIALCLNNLGILYLETGNYEKAKNVLWRAGGINLKMLGELHPNYLNSLNSIAGVYQAINKYDSALFLYDYLLPLYQKRFGEKQDQYTNVLSNMAMSYMNLHNYTMADSLMQMCLSFTKEIHGINHPDYAFRLANYAEINYRIGNYKKAEDILKSVNQLIHSQIKINFTFLSEEEKQFYFTNLSTNYLIYNSWIFRKLSDVKSLSITSYNNELQNKGLILRSSQIVKSALFNLKDTFNLKILNKLSICKQQLSKIYSLPKEKYPLNLKVLEEDAERMNKSLLRNSKEYNDYIQRFEKTWLDIKSTLKDKEASLEFISFHYYSNKWSDSILYFASIIRPGYTHPEYVFLFEEKELSSVIQKNNGELDQAYINNLYKLKDGNNRLAQLIWGPLDSLLQGVTTLYVAPSGLLHKIALGAIPTNGGNTILSKYGLQILGTTGDIVNKKDGFINKKSIEEAIVFGGINYDVASTKPVDFNSTSPNNIYAYIPTDSTRGANGKWNYLGGSLNEAQEIAKEFKEQKIITHFYSDSTATETLFKNMPINTNSIIHIATHGYFFPDIKRKKEDNMLMIGEEKQTAFKVSENPLLRSGLIFAGANPSWTNPDYVSTATDDGILTAYEISNMDLSNVKLVVLSACETGLGDIKGSEGVFGLQRSFKMAGVKNIIMSLWKVPDEKTRELMQVFYQFCFTGKSVSEAFKASQESMRVKYPTSPYYWAGFTLLQ